MVGNSGARGPIGLPVMKLGRRAILSTGGSVRPLLGERNVRSGVRATLPKNLIALEGAGISLYVNGMSEKAGEETINGVPITDAQIDAWVAEAEAGYDVEQLKKRGRGRPGRGAEPSQVVALRLTREEIEAVDARAQREHKSRSEVIREALRTSVA